jgi:Putative  PD-(D/E)XK family member, (DUF4420)
MGGRLMVNGAKASRHLRWEFFAERIEQRLPRREPVQGTPRIELFIEPGGRRIGAWFFSDEIVGVASPLAEVAIRPIRHDQRNALEMSTGNQSLFRDFYALCCQIADRIQIAEEPIPQAVHETLKSWATITRRKQLLSDTQQIGLIGELLFLQQVGTRLSWECAARGWYGPNCEEHDFVLPSVDVEVKTTAREQRIHEISSLQQLLPKGRRPLHLISVQLTPADTARDATSLPELVAKVIAAASTSSAAAGELIRDRLEILNWADDDREYYRTRYCLRSPMEACRVDRKFPAIVPEALRSLGRRASRIQAVAYSINVDGLGEREGTRKFNLLFS